MAAQFVAVPEFAATYGQPTDQAFVQAMYENTLHRAPDAGGLAFWTGHLAAGDLDRPGVVLAFSESGEHAARVAAAQPPPGAGHSVSISGAFSAGTDPQGGGGASAALVGGPGDDTLRGGTGQNVLTGGGGDDTFVVEPQSSNTVTDFHRGDHVLFRGFPGGAQPREIATGAGGVLAFDADPAHPHLGTVTFQGLTAADAGWVRDAFVFG